MVDKTEEQGDQRNTETPQVTDDKPNIAMNKQMSLPDEKKDDLVNRALSGMVDFEDHKERIGDRVTKNMSVSERAAAYNRGDSSKSPYRNTAKIMESPRRARTPSPEENEE